MMYVARAASNVASGDVYFCIIIRDINITVDNKEKANTKTSYQCFSASL